MHTFTQYSYSAKFGSQNSVENRGLQKISIKDQRENQLFCTYSEIFYFLIYRVALFDYYELSFAAL